MLFTKYSSEYSQYAIGHELKFEIFHMDVSFPLTVNTTSFLVSIELTLRDED